MEPLRLNTREAILILTLIGIGIGVLFGLIPLIYGKMRGKFKLGLIGFIASILSGAIWSVLPLFVMLTFVFLILRDSKPHPVEVEIVNQDPIDVSVKESDEHPAD